MSTLKKNIVVVLMGTFLCSVRAAENMSIAPINPYSHEIKSDDKKFPLSLPNKIGGYYIKPYQYPYHMITLPADCIVKITNYNGYMYNKYPFTRKKSEEYFYTLYSKLKNINAYFTMNKLIDSLAEKADKHNIGHTTYSVTKAIVSQHNRIVEDTNKKNISAKEKNNSSQFEHWLTAFIEVKLLIFLDNTISSMQRQLPISHKEYNMIVNYQEYIKTLLDNRFLKGTDLAHPYYFTKTCKVPLTDSERLVNSLFLFLEPYRWNNALSSFFNNNNDLPTAVLQLIGCTTGAVITTYIKHQKNCGQVTSTTLFLFGQIAASLIVSEYDSLKNTAKLCEIPLLLTYPENEEAIVH